MLAGFALVKRIATNPEIFDMGEFFVLRNFGAAVSASRRPAGYSLDIPAAGRFANYPRICPRKASGGASSPTTRWVISATRKSGSKPTARNVVQRFVAEMPGRTKLKNMIYNT